MTRFRPIDANHIPGGLCNTQAPEAFAPALRRTDLLFHIAILTLALVVLTLSLLLNTENQRRVVVPGVNWSLPELCNFRRVLGRDCPGCGMTRGFISCAHGDLASAWSHNPASIPLFIACVLQFPYRLIQIYRLRAGKRPLLVPYVGIFAGALVVVLLGHWTWGLLVLHT